MRPPLAAATALAAVRAPLAFVAAAFGLGIGLGWRLAPSLPALCLLLLLAAIGLWRARGRPAAANLALLVFVVILGILRAEADGRVPAAALARALTVAPQPITCEGMIISDVEWVRPAQGPARRQGWFRIARIRNGESWIPSQGRVLLKLHSYNAPLAYGDRVCLSGSIRGPRPVVKDENDGRRRFDEGNRLWMHGAFGILTIAGPEAITRLDSVPSPWIGYRRWVSSFRRRLRDVGRSLLGPLETAYLEAFLLGDGQAIPRAVWDAFRKVGVVHVLVVSGLHVGLIASIGLVGLSLIRIPRGWRYPLLGAGLVTYCLLSGGNPPILRATVMGIVLCAGKAGGREVAVLNSMGLAALLILAWSPRALADPSFQLSFAAVLGLFILAPVEGKLREESEDDAESLGQRWGRTAWRWTGRGLAASCGAWIAVSPFVAWHFRLFTPMALIANLLVIPWASLLIAVGFLVYLAGWIHPAMAAPFAAAFSRLACGLNRLVGWMADLPGASWAW